MFLDCRTGRGAEERKRERQGAGGKEAKRRGGGRERGERFNPPQRNSPLNPVSWTRRQNSSPWATPHTMCCLFNFISCEKSIPKRRDRGRERRRTRETDGDKTTTMQQAKINALTNCCSSERHSGNNVSRLWWWWSVVCNYVENTLAYTASFKLVLFHSLRGLVSTLSEVFPITFQWTQMKKILAYAVKKII